MILPMKSWAEFCLLSAAALNFLPAGRQLSFSAGFPALSLLLSLLLKNTSRPVKVRAKSWCSQCAQGMEGF